MSLETLSELLHTYNHTELYQACLEAGVVASPEMSEDVLINQLIGDDTIQQVSNPIDEWRRGISIFVENNWDRLQNQLVCPLRTPQGQLNKFACFSCIDAHVMSCIVSNSNNEEAIWNYAKKDK